MKEYEFRSRDKHVLHKQSKHVNTVGMHDVN